MSYNIEKAIATWIVSDWHRAQQTGSWDRVCDFLYGAIQSCVWNGDDEGYETYKTLVELARELRYIAQLGIREAA